MEPSDSYSDLQEWVAVQVHPVLNWIDANVKTLPSHALFIFIAKRESDYLETSRAMFGKYFAMFIAEDETFGLIKVTN